jgi:hypothetical protein
MKCRCNHKWKANKTWISIGILALLHELRRCTMAKLNIKKAIKKPGQLHRDLGVPQGQNIPTKKLNAAAKKEGKVGQRARFAKTLKKL